MNDLYREEFMEIYKNPSNRGKIAVPTFSSRGVNSMCGDELDLYLRVEKGVITEAKFESVSCSVSIVSASILTEILVGKTIAQAKDITKEELLSLVGVNLSTSRVKCATLALETLKKGIEEYETRSR